MIEDDDRRTPAADSPYSPGRRRTAAVEKLRRQQSEFARSRPTSSESESPPNGSWKRQTWKLPRAEARLKAKEFLARYPRAAYWSEVESWRVLEGDIIEFTMRRLPTAD